MYGASGFAGSEYSGAGASEIIITADPAYISLITAPNGSVHVDDTRTAEPVSLSATAIPGYPVIVLSISGERADITNVDALDGDVAHGASAQNAASIAVQAPNGVVDRLISTLPPPPPGATVDVTGPPAAVSVWSSAGTVRQDVLDPGSPPVQIFPEPVFPPPITPVPGVPFVERTITAFADGTLLQTASEISWLDEYNGVGNGTLKVPSNHPDAALLTRDTTIMCHYAGRPRFAWTVETRTTDVVADPGSGWVTVNGRGLLAYLEDAVVYPFNGLQTLSFDQRGFNFASGDVGEHGYVRQGSTATYGSRQDQDSVRRGYPEDWPDPAARWIWTGNPSMEVATDEARWFRSAFSIGEQPHRLYVTGDNGFSVWIDGVLLASAGVEDSGGYTWQTTTEVDLELPPGGHVIGLRGQNLQRISPGPNPAGVMCSLMTLTGGEPDEVVWRTGPWWEGFTEPPAWYAGDVLLTLLTEAQERGVTRLLDVEPTFTMLTGSDGRPFTTRVSRSWSVGESLLSVALDLCEMGLDVWMTPDKKLHCVESRGEDKRDSVKFDYGLNLTGYVTDDTYSGASHVLTRTETGWFTIQIPEGEAILGGRREVGMSMRTLENEDTVADIVHVVGGSVLQSSCIATPTAVVPIDGSIPYQDVNIGDHVTTLNSFGALRDGKVLSISVTEDSAGVPLWTPELEIWLVENDIAAPSRRRFAPRPVRNEGGGSSSSGGGGGAHTNTYGPGFDGLGTADIPPSRQQAPVNPSDYQTTRPNARHIKRGLVPCVFSVTGDLEVFAGSHKYVAELSGRLGDFRATLGTSAQGAPVVVVLKVSGNVVATVEIPEGEYSAKVSPSPETIKKGQTLTVSVTQVGTTRSGSDLVAQTSIR